MSTTTTSRPKTAKASPITVTITGALARKIGDYARTSGASPSEAALMLASLGEGLTSPEAAKATTKTITNVGALRQDIHTAIGAMFQAAFSASDHTADMLDHMTPAQLRKLTKVAKDAGWKDVQGYVQHIVVRGLAELADAHAKLPVYLPAKTVRLLEELCAASGFGDADRYAGEFINAEILASLDSQTGDLAGVPLALVGAYQLEAGDIEAMQAVVDRWNAATGG